MNIGNKREPIVLFLGDMFCFVVALWLTLLVRYGRPPSPHFYYQHFVPFFILLLIWTIVFFIAGLYEKHTILLQNRLPGVILNAQLINSGLAVIFFYYIAYFGITPKRNLFIYLIIYFILVLSWRIYGYVIFSGGNRQNAFLIGSGEEMEELREEVNNNSRYNLKFISSIDLDVTPTLNFEKEILSRLKSNDITIVAIDLKDKKVLPIIPHLYNLIYSKIHFIDMHKIYEDIFDRIPLSLIGYNWFLENISATPKVTYDILKRLMDLIVSFLLGILSLIVYPFVILAIKLEDNGPIFFVQDRVGKNNQIFKNIKFRTMVPHDEKDGIAKNPMVTKVGLFLRKTRIDEIPQLLNVFLGDVSLIGPRPEIPRLVELYEKGIPYYNIRHLIKPGLSGWAQLGHAAPPKFTVGYDATKVKLSYDLYYIKNRSLILDIKIALRTVKTLLSRSGI